MLDRPEEVRGRVAGRAFHSLRVRGLSSLLPWGKLVIAEIGPSSRSSLAVRKSLTESDLYRCVDSLQRSG
jgi:hypothetical protein